MLKPDNVNQDRPTTGAHTLRRKAEASIAEKLPELLAKIRRGMTLSDASAAVGISPSTAKYWITTGMSGAAEITAALAEVEARAEDDMREGMWRFLTHYRMGLGKESSAVAAGFRADQAKTWRHGKRFPHLAAWFASELAAASIGRAKGINQATPDKPSKRGCVYFIQGVDGGCIKIGFTAGPVEKRLLMLQVGSPVQLRVLHAVEANKSSENWAHAHFIAHRSHGEWYHPHKDLMAFIKQGGLMLLARPTVQGMTGSCGPRGHVRYVKDTKEATA